MRIPRVKSDHAVTDTIDRYKLNQLIETLLTTIKNITNQYEQMNTRHNTNYLLYKLQAWSRI